MQLLRGGRFDVRVPGQKVVEGTRSVFFTSDDDEVGQAAYFRLTRHPRSWSAIRIVLRVLPRRTELPF